MVGCVAGMSAVVAFAFGDLGICRAASPGYWTATASLAITATTTTTTAAILYLLRHFPDQLEEPDEDPQAAGYAEGFPDGVPGPEGLARELLFPFCVSQKSAKQHPFYSSRCY